MVSNRVRFSVFWKRVSISFKVIVFTGIIVSFLLYNFTRESGDISNALRLVTFNLLVVILCLLGFLITRNIIKLVFERRSGIFGSKLRTKLVASFFCLTLIPTAITFFFASGLVTKLFDGWFAPQVESAVEGAIEVARSQLDGKTQEARRRSLEVLSIVRNTEQSLLEKKLEMLRSENQFFSIKVLNPALGVLIDSTSAASASLEEPEIDEGKAFEAQSDKQISSIERKGANQFVRIYQLVILLGRKHILITTSLLDPELSGALSAVSDSYKDYQQLKKVRTSIQTGYILTLGVVTLLILFGAVWIGFYVSRQMLSPLLKLAEGTKAVSRGDYGFRLSERGNDEFSFLAGSFNKMLIDLNISRNESEVRREEVEGILRNLAVGVLKLDESMNISLWNDAAQGIFSPKILSTGMPLAEVFSLEFSSLDNYEGKATLETLKGRREFLVTLGKIRTGYVLLFDDITEIIKGEQEAAWREVARRVAHEIKNPLTPIQLAAQRLEKKFFEEGLPASGEISEILQSVESIKRLTNEFSKHARLPLATFSKTSLAKILRATVNEFAEQSEDIVFNLITDPGEMLFECDVEQIRRAIINLIKNAITALNASHAERKRITVKGEEAHDEVSIQIIDSGPGIPESDRARVFEPYFTRSKDGTGLGLSIVSSIVYDHNGKISLDNVQPHGVKVVMSFPKHQPKNRGRFG